MTCHTTGAHAAPRAPHPATIVRHHLVPPAAAEPLRSAAALSRWHQPTRLRRPRLPIAAIAPFAAIAALLAIFAATLGATTPPPTTVVIGRAGQ